MDEIVDGLWISDIETVQSTDTTHCDTVISVCQDTADDNVGCAYEHVALADDVRSQRRWGGSINYDSFSTAVETAHTAFESGTTCVHCHNGQNRSAAVCAALIGVEYGESFGDALTRISTVRPIVEPNGLMSYYAETYIANNS